MAKRRTPQAVREALLEAGARLFARGGMAATNSNQIAREAGMGVGSFYRHFEDKHALADALHEDWTHTLRRRSQRAAQAADGLEAQVRALVEVAVDLVEEHPDRFRVVSAHPPRRSALRLSLRPVEKRLAELEAQGELAAGVAPAVAAKAFEAMQAGVLAWWREDPSRATREDVIETLVALHPALAGRVRASVR